MHPTAKKCLQWAVGLLVLGALIVIYGAQTYAWLVELAGANADVGLDAVNIILTILRSALFPMGAVLIGVAILIQVLTADVRPREGHAEQRDDR